MTVEQVSNEQLRAFLRHDGWRELPDRGPAGESWVLDRVGVDAPAILVPGDPEDRDYLNLMRSAIQRLLWVTGLSESELISQIVSISTDVLEISVVDPTTVTGRIALDRGVLLTQALRAVVMNGARLQFAGGRVAHTGGLTEAARRIVDQLELAPPSPGSFRLEVFAPAEQMQLTQGEAAPPSAAHETLASAMRAVGAVRDTTEKEIPDDADALDDAVSEGLSTNLVRAVSKLDTQSPALRVVFRGRWSKPDPSTPQLVTLEPQHMAKLPRLEQLLRRYDPQERFALSGWIKEISADALALEDTPLTGVAVVEARVEGRTRDVRVELGGEALKRAAAGIGEQYLNATGTLERIGRDWYLTDPKDVRIGDVGALPEGR
jgi:hypothetical protein